MSHGEMQIRKRLEQELRERIPDAPWEMLRKRRYVNEVRAGLMSIRGLAEEVREFKRFGNTRMSSGETQPAFLSARRQKRGKAIPSRHEAISVLVAELARARSDVREFRQAFLKDQIILWKDIESWLESHTASSNLYAVIKCPATCRPFYQEGRWTLDPLPPALTIEKLLPLEVLFYMTPDEDCVKSVPVGGDGSLFELLVLSGKLCHEYGWEPAQAVVFLLADCVPVVSLFRATASFNLEYSSLCRITMTVDPVTTPRELAAKYAKLRRQLFTPQTGAKRTRPKRVRAISEKHAQLAMFSVRNGPLDQKQMSVWNRLNPAWRYERYSIFSRDARVAKARLLRQLDPSLEVMTNPPTDDWSSLHAGSKADWRSVQEVAHGSVQLGGTVPANGKTQKGRN